MQASYATFTEPLVDSRFQDDADHCGRGSGTAISGHDRRTESSL